jgi:Mannosylglycerate hydrolase MGH1-like glycoside hydrolase domain
MGETIESIRLREARQTGAPWRKWGPYLSERQWGTVREDYSKTGDAWSYFTHDQARSRAYLWGEDGIAGVSDDKQNLCFAVALWNGVDPIIKERLFGLTNSEGNHGEDVKEYYYYLDSTPTHSYMKYLYKYPQSAFPYDDLVRTNASRGRYEQEYELINTAVFDEDRYFDVFVEYAKASPDDLLIQVTAWNRGPEPAVLVLLPTLWFRNTWWHLPEEEPRPWVRTLPAPSGKSRSAGGKSGAASCRTLEAQHSLLGTYYLACEGDPQFLVVNNETNTQRVFGTPNTTKYVKDGINDYVVAGDENAVNPEGEGTKAAAHYLVTIAPGDSAVLRLRLRAGDDDPTSSTSIGSDFDTVFSARQAEADEFYAALTPPELGEDGALVMRQAMAGMLWTKQCYTYDVDRWLRDRGARKEGGPKPPTRNSNWFHMVNQDIISMPDKWEYPWFAAWDLAFHTIALSMVDLDFAKQQLELMLSENYMHPNGQLPAYEWDFGDVNPPVHAWAAEFLFNLEREIDGQGDLEFLERMFVKLLMTFTWWVNRKDRTGSNVFEGGFLGLDNIGVFDRSAPLPTGGYLEQADGTAWMAFFCQNMLSMAVKLAIANPAYELLACKFYEHFLWIAGAMDRMGEHEDEMWDPEDGFFYDLLRLPDGSATRLKVRSLVGLLSLCASSVFPHEGLEKLPKFREGAVWFTENHPELVANIASPAVKDGRHLLALLNEDKLRQVLARLLDENEFLSPYGVRSLSRYHLEHPYVFGTNGQEFRVGYLPAESDTGMFGGNSNWRGPIWFPTSALLVRALLTLYSYYGDDFTIECPTGSGVQATLFDAAMEIMRRSSAIFLRDADGRRPVFGGAEKFQTDPHWRDYLLFYEYFHGDNGAGLGASHQTGWTGVVARFLRMSATFTKEAVRSGDFAKKLAYGLAEEEEVEV